MLDPIRATARVVCTVSLEQNSTPQKLMESHGEPKFWYLATAVASGRVKNMRSILLTILFSVGIGFGVWALSPFITGEKEPWDAHYPFYSTLLISGGALITVAKGRWAVLCVPGIWLGQLLALATLPWLDRSWWQLALFTTAVGSLVAFLGNVLGLALRLLLRESID